MAKKVPVHGKQVTVSVGEGVKKKRIAKHLGIDVAWSISLKSISPVVTAGC